VGGHLRRVADVKATAHDPLMTVPDAYMINTIVNDDQGSRLMRWSITPSTATSAAAMWIVFARCEQSHNTNGQPVFTQS
jgi:hypothetical protein